MTQTSPLQTTGNRLVFEDSIQVEAPIGEVYRRWTDFQRFPTFMENVEEVRPLGNDRYHWIARIFGVKQEWDAEVIDQQPNSRVSWRSLSGPYNQGTVSFSQLGTG
ncbi:MAG TPA: SRPBCC family protein, partial [Ktedonobacterales bacterium]|nr:SRPBCC family protein [Ktedonobacterales bacterium]